MTATAERKRARLAEIRAEIEQHKADSRGLYAERDRLVVQLKDAGVTRAELAALAGVGVDMVKQILSAGRASAPARG